MLFRQCGDWGRLVTLLSIFGNFVMLEGDFALAQQKLDEAARLSDQVNDKDAEAVLLSTLGRMATIQGDYGQAYGYLQEALDLWEELGTRMTVLWCRAHLGYLALREGKIAEAHKTFAEAAQDFQIDQNEGGVAFSLEGMAWLYITVDKPVIAARLIGWADITREKIGDTRPRLEQLDVDHLIAACIAKIGEVAYANAYDEGRKLTLDEAVAYALSKG
jgi:tetratricopeptide (TPR) repeat protein